MLTKGTLKSSLNKNQVFQKHILLKVYIKGFNRKKYWGKNIGKQILKWTQPGSLICYHCSQLHLVLENVDRGRGSVYEQKLSKINNFLVLWHFLNVITVKVKCHRNGSSLSVKHCLKRNYVYEEVSVTEIFLLRQFFEESALRPILS